MKTNRISFPTGLLLSIFLISAGCHTEGTSSNDPVFHKCWVNAFEEESQDDIMIFRPCLTHTFPVSRYRNTFTLNENNEVEYSVLAPNDAHTTEEGKWSYDPQTKKLRFVNAENIVVSEYEVLELKEDLLRLRQ